MLLRRLPRLAGRGATVARPAAAAGDMGLAASGTCQQYTPQWHQRWQSALPQPAYASDDEEKQADYQRRLQEMLATSSGKSQRQAQAAAAWPTAEQVAERLRSSRGTSCSSSSSGASSGSFASSDTSSQPADNSSTLDWREVVAAVRASGQHISGEQMLTDTFGRRHTYLRISLTERCNLRCLYCMPEEGVDLTPAADVMSTAEVLRVAGLFAGAGVDKIRLTGGEPTLRKGGWAALLHRACLGIALGACELPAPVCIVRACLPASTAERPESVSTNGVQFLTCHPPALLLVTPAPALAADLVEMTGRLSQLPGIKAVGLTSNGLTLGRKLPQLKEAGGCPAACRTAVCLCRAVNSGAPTAMKHSRSLNPACHWRCSTFPADTPAGLSLLNISLDTLQPERFVQMTRRQGHDRVLAAIHQAAALGFDPGGRAGGRSRTVVVHAQVRCTLAPHGLPANPHPPTCLWPAFNLNMHPCHSPFAPPPMQSRSTWW